MSERAVQLRRSAVIFALAIVFVVGGAFGLLGWALAGPSGLRHERVVPVFVTRAAAAAASQDGSSMGFAPVLKPVLPAVVSIASSRIVKVPQSQLFNDPSFQQFFGQQSQGAPRQEREQGLGSGVIISADGYILTNNHVIDKATEIKVILSDKREFPGKVVGADSKTDIAVVKIAASGLPTVTLGDSSKLQVGDYAFAIGNPFGVGETATMGIISATGRNGLDIEDYEDFIQTDAAINPGNSGGALLDARGEVIGINTAILSGGSGGNQGIGFAIPINMAKYVMDQILKHGKVIRGYIGVGIQELTPDLAKQFNVPAEKGALVGSVEPSSPAAKAGLQTGDVITELDSQPITGPNDLRLKVGKMAPGTSVHLKVLRNGETRDVSLKLGEAPSGKATAKNAQGPADNSPMKGVQVDTLTNDIRQQLGLGTDVKGMVVTEVPDGSPAAEVGLQRGDVIEQVNRHPVDSVGDYERLIREAGAQPVVLLINHGGNTGFLVVHPE
jgi:serine protease Do